MANASETDRKALKVVKLTMPLVDRPATWAFCTEASLASDVQTEG